MPQKAHVPPGMDGWLNVKREPSGTVIALPEFTAVEIESSANGRDHFVVKEGVESGRQFSVKSGNLRPGSAVYQPAVSLRFSLGRELLSYPGGQVKAITHPRNPIAVQVHPIQIPDFPHTLGLGYIGHSQYAKSWFYLGSGHAVSGNNDRYLHPGSVSMGCITVEPSEWTKLYQYLIRSRSGNGKTVGTVTVVR